VGALLFKLLKPFSGKNDNYNEAGTDLQFQGPQGLYFFLLLKGQTARIVQKKFKHLHVIVIINLQHSDDCSVPTVCNEAQLVPYDEDGELPIVNTITMET
jgi:hypothetical protein